MERATTLRIRFDAFNHAQKQWSKNEFRDTLSDGEREAFRLAFEQARTELEAIITEIKQHPVLVLHSLSEAKAFLLLRSRYFENCGTLDRLEIDNDVVNATKNKMIRALQEGGMTLEEPFRFPVPAPAQN
ncbi:hypothetical protein NL676_017051 [Syzygium grande]|nr:hypothetical protein NL676_017051 [Syzygium grande]